MVKVIALLLSAIVAASETEEVDHTGLLQTTKHRSVSRSVTSRASSSVHWQGEDADCGIFNLCCKSVLEDLKAEAQRDIDCANNRAAALTSDISAETAAIAAAEASKADELAQTATALAATSAAIARCDDLTADIEQTKKNHKEQSDKLEAEYLKLKTDFEAVRNTASKVMRFVDPAALCTGDQYAGYGTGLLQQRAQWGDWGWFNNMVNTVVETVSDKLEDVVVWTCEEVIDKLTDKVCHSTVEAQRDQFERDLAAAEATVTQLKADLEKKKAALAESLALAADARQQKLEQIKAQTAAEDAAKKLVEELATLEKNNAAAIAKLEGEIKVMQGIVAQFKSMFSETLFKEMRDLGSY